MAVGFDRNQRRYMPKIHRVKIMMMNLVVILVFEAALLLLLLLAHLQIVMKN